MYDEAKSREVSPKLVVRGKKYGRRSRPQSVAPFESSQSDSEEDYDFARVPTVGEKSKTYHKVSGGDQMNELISCIISIVFISHCIGPTICITRRYAWKKRKTCSIVRVVYGKQ